MLCVTVFTQCMCIQCVHYQYMCLTIVVCGKQSPHVLTAQCSKHRDLSLIIIIIIGLYVCLSLCVCIFLSVSIYACMHGCVLECVMFACVCKVSMMI